MTGLTPQESYGERSHGPLAPLPDAWYEHPLSGAARCLDWPHGCGERTRMVGTSASLRHRDGCPVQRAVKLEESILHTLTTGGPQWQHLTEIITGTRLPAGTEPVDLHAALMAMERRGEVESFTVAGRTYWSAGRD